MHLRLVAGSGLWRRSLATVALLLLASFFAAPAASALLSSAQPSKDCCPTSGHGCCRRSDHDGDGLKLAAAMQCRQKCGGAAGFSIHGYLLLHGAKASIARRAPQSNPLVTERPAASASGYLAFLYQRPPPSV